MSDFSIVFLLQETLVNFIQNASQANEKLLALQLDKNTEPKVLQTHTRACAIHAASLRNLLQILKLLTSPQLSAEALSPTLAGLFAALPDSDDSGDHHSPVASSSSTPNPQPKTPNSPPSAPTPSTPPPTPVSSPHSPAPSSLPTQNSKLRIQNSPPPTPSTPPTPAAENPQPSALGSVSAALPKFDQNNRNLNKTVPGQVFPPPRPPAGWYAG